MCVCVCVCVCVFECVCVCVCVSVYVCVCYGTWALNRVTEGMSMMLANSFASSSDSACSPICLKFEGHVTKLTPHKRS